MITLSSTLEESKIVLSFYVKIDGIAISMLVFLQINTIQTSNALYNESAVSISNKIKKKMTKISMRIILLYTFFASPHIIVYLICYKTD